jgi:peptidoglycan/LPS O-acetylase OafA/YrhL
MQGAVRHPHIGELQAIRGLAAVVVLFHHSLFYFSTTPDFRFFSEALLNAHAAVVVFFVLSGYVLTRSLYGKPRSFRLFTIFFVRRAFRILPALWAGLLLASFYLFEVRGSVSVPHLSQWIADYHPGPARLKEFAGAAVGADASLLPPLWSIRTELLASCFIPLMAAALAYGSSAMFAIAVLTATAALVGEVFGAGIFIYLTDFVLGAAILSLKPLGRWWPGSRWMVVVASVMVLLFGRLASPDWRFDVGYHAVLPGLIEGVAAATLIHALVSDRRLGRVLRDPRLIWLGDVSYSLYIVHFPVMALVAIGLTIFFPATWLWGPDFAAIVLAGCTLVLSLGLAHISYIGIELPGIGLGRRLLARMFPPKTPRRGPGFTTSA